MTEEIISQVKTINGLVYTMYKGPPGGDATVKWTMNGIEVDLEDFHWDLVKNGDKSLPMEERRREHWKKLDIEGERQAGIKKEDALNKSI